MFDNVSAAAEPAAAGPGPLTDADLEALVAGLAELDTALTDADRVTRLDTLERVKAACAAAQATITAAFVDSQQQVADAWHAQAAECSDRGDFEGWRAARDRARDAEFVPPGGDAAGQDASAGAARRRQRGQHSTTGVAAQIGLARRESPARGARLVSTALALTHRLPHTLAALRAGLLSEHRAELVVSHTRHLSPTLQTLVDHQVIGGAGKEVGTWGTRELERRVRACADRLDAAAAAARARHAENDRRVTLRPVPDTMAALTALLPVAQAVAVHTALTAAADRAKAAGDPRSKGQIMADTLVALVTGQETADDLPIEIHHHHRPRPPARRHHPGSRPRLRPRARRMGHRPDHAPHQRRDHLGHQRRERPGRPRGHGPRRDRARGDRAWGDRSHRLRGGRPHRARGSRPARVRGLGARRRAGAR